MLDKIKHVQSPNFNERPTGTIIDSIILHYSGMACVEDVISHFKDPKPQNNNPVSAHYVICREGQITNMVCPSKRAWHAGRSEFGCREEFNHFSIGIELYNPGHRRGYIPYTDLQMNSTIGLISWLSTQHPIDPRWVLGHSDISSDRKQDPGELFPWSKLEECHLAIRPDVNKTKRRLLRMG
jgi:N-acetylmuramoyl-L-alanine amidase